MIGREWLALSEASNDTDRLSVGAKGEGYLGDERVC
jgi:hypothetical protein